MITEIVFRARTTDHMGTLSFSGAMLQMKDDVASGAACTLGWLPGQMEMSVVMDGCARRTDNGTPAYEGTGRLVLSGASGTVREMATALEKTSMLSGDTEADFGAARIREQVF